MCLLYMVPNVKTCPAHPASVLSECLNIKLPPTYLKNASSILRLDSIDKDINLLIVKTEMIVNRSRLAGGIRIIPNRIRNHLVPDPEMVVIGLALIWTHRGGDTRNHLAPVEDRGWRNVVARLEARFVEEDVVLALGDDNSVHLDADLAGA